MDQTENDTVRGTDVTPEDAQTPAPKQSKFKTLFHKLCNRETILYLVFGVLTTAVDWGVSFLLYYFWGDAIDQNNILIHGADVIAWICAVLFAFFTNRVWVFASDKKGFGAVLGELGLFALGRVATLGVQEALVFVFFTIIGINKYIVKIGVAVIVVILNYFFSKLLVFRKKKKETTHGQD